MRYRLFLILSSLLMMAGTCNKEKNNDGRENLVIESTFESSDPFKGWGNSQHCCDYSLIQSTDKSTEGNNSLRIEVRSTDPQTSSSIRSELTQGGDGVGAERWYGFNIFLQNWMDDDAGECVFQWHPENLTGTATAALWTSGGRFVFVMNEGDVNSGNEYIDIGPIISNQWISWVIHVKWASDNTGIMQVWKNGNLVINKSRIITAPPVGTYFKLGINKFGWGIQPSSTTERILYYDEVRIGDEKASYADVVPGP
ncbi:MAG TPA: polysaccharide lyase [Chitinophagaceae bacterium]